MLNVSQQNYNLKDFILNIFLYQLVHARVDLLETQKLNVFDSQHCAIVIKTAEPQTYA